MHRKRELSNWDFPYNGVERSVYASLALNALKDAGIPGVGMFPVKGKSRTSTTLEEADRVYFTTAAQQDKVASITYRDSHMTAAMPSSMDGKVVRGIFGSKELRKY